MSDLENCDGDGSSRPPDEYLKWLADEEAQREYQEWLDGTYCPVEFEATGG